MRLLRQAHLSVVIGLMSLTALLLIAACQAGPQEGSPPTPDPSANGTPEPEATPAQTPGPETTPGPTPAPSGPPELGDLGEPRDLGTGGLTGLVEPDDGSGRLFILEQDGRILTLPKDGWQDEGTSYEVFLDIRDQVHTGGWEEGLLGLAFHPAFQENGYFYVHYSRPGASVFSRFSTDADDPTSADPVSEEVLLEVDQPFGNHNGGQLAFGPDGYLYIALGDGGSGGDPQGHGQNTQTLLGTILRLDVDGAEAGQGYAIPADNPFVDDPDVLDEIWAYGLRNPWRFSMDSHTGAIWIADVGQDEWEAVYVAEGGENFGWNVVEGEECYPPGADCDPSEFDAPVHTYPIAGEAECAITGGYVYRGLHNPALQGTYVFGDFCSGVIWGLRDEGGAFEHYVLADSGLAITSFGRDQDGELYLVTHDGKVLALTPPAS